MEKRIKGMPCLKTLARYPVVTQHELDNGEKRYRQEMSNIGYCIRRSWYLCGR